MNQLFYLTIMMLTTTLATAQVVDVAIYGDCSKNGYTKAIVPSTGTVEVKNTAGRTSCDYVQLWEGGPKWATFNVGATITDYAHLMVGADPIPLNNYKDKASYYNTANLGGLYAWNNPNINGRKTVWNSSVSTGIGDVATTLWGSNWETPTKEQLDTLQNSSYGKTICTWCDGSTTQYVVGCMIAGWKVSGKNAYADKSIFVPAAGYYSYGYGAVFDVSNIGYYWTSSVFDSNNAYTLGFRSNVCNVGSDGRGYGRTLRAVLANNAVPTQTFHLTLNANGCEPANVFVSPKGQQLRITAVPQDCQRFVRWNDGNTDNPRTITINSDTTFTAEFAPKQYTISANATNGTIIGGGKYDCNATITLTATPNKYYHFVKWSDGNTDNPRTITVTKDSTFEAEFRLDAAGDIEYVDLGLSVVWATCNLGASSPEEYGGYYAWGETSTKTTYDWETYKYGKGSRNLIKYCTDSDFGIVDNRTILEKGDDAANASLGYSWRMPTSAEGNELLYNCTWTWTNQNGINGYRVTSKVNGNSIFLPVSGYYQNNDLLYSGQKGRIWLSTISSYNQQIEYITYRSGDIGISQTDRYQGFSIRAVCPTNVELFNISTYATNGSVTGSGTYQQGATATLTATNSDCYSFQKWSDGNTDNPRSVVVTQDSTFTAIFVGTGYQETVNCTVVNESPYGTVSFTGTVIKDSNISLKATAPECSKFVRWSDNDTSNPRNLTVTQDSTLTAIFEKIQFNVSIDTNDPKKGKVVME